jgi:hypothetical protein
MFAVRYSGDVAGLVLFDPAEGDRVVDWTIPSGVHRDCPDSDGWEYHTAGLLLKGFPAIPVEFDVRRVPVPGFNSIAVQLF